MGRKSSIPDRWLDYKPIGKQIPDTRFIAFKVPLKEGITKNLEGYDEVKLDQEQLMLSVPNLGLVIDLTNTNRYYHPKCFEDKGVKYKKVMIPGHVTPAKHLVDEFKHIVKNFLKTNKTNDKLIGVHCTHGVNRTGYLICNYMISELSMKPKEAIKKFGEARGHKIERENYLDDLLQMKSTNRHQHRSKSVSQSSQPSQWNEKQQQHRPPTYSKKSNERGRNRHHDDNGDAEVKRTWEGYSKSHYPSNQHCEDAPYDVDSCNYNKINGDYHQQTWYNYKGYHHRSSKSIRPLHSNNKCEVDFLQYNRHKNNDHISRNRKQYQYRPVRWHYHESTGQGGFANGSSWS